MKRVQLLAAFFITALAVSCSSDDGGDGGENFQASFEYVLDGSPVSLAVSQASKSQNSMAVVASDAEGNSIEFTFDKFGNLGTVGAFFEDINEPSLSSHRNNSGHYFTFELVELNESNKTVKAEFSGKLYEDENDLNSDFKEVSGSFWLQYTEVTPVVPDLEVSATIDGNDWYSTNSYTSNGDGGSSTFILHELSDDAFKIMLGFDDDNITPGTYTFTPSSNFNFARVAVYNMTLKYYEDYDCTGTFTITSNETVGFIKIVSGTYSFTAVNPDNPSETIQVTSGKFKTNYSW